jgi:hypothetical protein
MTPVYCFECGVEVPESQKVFRNGRIYCSQTHAAKTRQTAAPPQVRAESQPKPAQNPAKLALAAQASTGPKVATNPPAATGRYPERFRATGLGVRNSHWALPRWLAIVSGLGVAPDDRHYSSIWRHLKLLLARERADARNR